jgi:hypothetical protein
VPECGIAPFEHADDIGYGSPINSPADQAELDRQIAENPSLRRRPPAQSAWVNSGVGQHRIQCALMELEDRGEWLDLGRVPGESRQTRRPQAVGKYRGVPVGEQQDRFGAGSGEVIDLLTQRLGQWLGVIDQQEDHTASYVVGRRCGAGEEEDTPGQRLLGDLPVDIACFSSDPGHSGLSPCGKLDDRAVRIDDPAGEPETLHIATSITRRPETCATELGGDVFRRQLQAAARVGPAQHGVIGDDADPPHHIPGSNGFRGPGARALS